MKLLRGSIGHFANLESVWPYWFLVFELFCYSKISFHLYSFVILKYEQYKSGRMIDSIPDNGDLILNEDGVFLKIILLNLL